MARTHETTMAGVTFDECADAIIDTVKSALKAVLPSRDARLTALEQTVAALKTDNEKWQRAAVETAGLANRVRVVEERPTLTYCGVYEQGRVYERGNVVTCAGHMWHANERTSKSPGFGVAYTKEWQLACKAGRDGRDGKDLR